MLMHRASCPLLVERLPTRQHAATQGTGDTAPGVATAGPSFVASFPIETARFHLVTELAH